MSAAAALQIVVLAELLELRKSGLGKLDVIDRKTGIPQLATPQLDRAARKIHGYHDRLTHAQAVKLLLEHEIEKIETHLCRIWLPSAFGLTEETRKKTPTECRDLARKLAGEQSENKWVRSDGGSEQEGINVLAAQIVSDCLLDIPITAGTADAYADVPHTTELDETSIITVASRVDPLAQSGSDYIVRQGIHDQFNAAVDAGARVIALVGHAGYGKTRLADALVRSRSGVLLAPRIGVQGTDLLSADLSGVIAQLDIAKYGPTWDARPRYLQDVGEAFARLINDPRSPEFIILDCRQARHLPREASSIHSARSRFIITCLPGFQLPENVTVIEVGPLEDSEATAMLRSRVPGMSASDVARLVPGLHGYPSAIVYVARLYARGIVPVDDILSILRCRADVFYERVPFPDGVTIASIANQIIDTVGNESSLALKILECMVFLERTDYVSRKFIEQYAALVDLASTPSPFPVSNALDTLARLQLIEVKRSAIRLKPQVRAALYQIMKPRLWRVARHCITYYRQYEEDIAIVLRVRRTRGDTAEFIREYNHAASAICHMFDVFAEADTTSIPCPINFTGDDLNEMAIYHDDMRTMLREGIVAKGWIHSAKSAQELTKTWTYAADQATDDDSLDINLTKY